MISELKFGKKYNNGLLQFIVGKKEIYITKDNKRYPINSLNDLKHLHRESAFSIVKEDAEMVKSVLFVWKSKGPLNRYYIKFAYDSIVDLDDLLMVLNWKFAKEVCVKLERGSPAIDSFRKKGFKFYHDRGGEVLLCRSKNERIFVAPYKEEDDAQPRNH